MSVTMIGTAAEDAVDYLEQVAWHLGEIYIDELADMSNAINLDLAHENLARLIESLAVVLGDDKLPPGLLLRLLDLRVSS